MARLVSGRSGLTSVSLDSKDCQLSSQSGDVGERSCWFIIRPGRRDVSKSVRCSAT